MNTELLLTAMLVQVMLTIAVYVVLAIRKAKAVKNGDVDLKRAALHNDAWPDYVLLISNNIQNQFQTPVLFYALCFGFILMDAVDSLALGGAWTYVITRLVHAYVHTTTNFVPVRMRVFTLGMVALIFMTGLLLVRLV
jgi:hypothetical protein